MEGGGREEGKKEGSKDGRMREQRKPIDMIGDFLYLASNVQTHDPNYIVCA